MKIKHPLIAGAAILAGGAIAVPALASPSTSGPVGKLPLTLAGHTFLYRVNDFTIGGNRVHGLVFIHQFARDGKQVTFTEVAGPPLGPKCEVETAHITKVGSGLFFVRWIEKSGIAIAGVHNLKTGHVQQWFVLPSAVTGASGPISVSPTGTYSRYTGAPPPPCTNRGSGQ